ncbi:hypothetical protein GCM10011387_31890 [Pedobacter quisquiliarum]|jgi:hypothetical protein|uniref:Transcriptional regulator, AbiEi antitoxin, Type IV TA system n=1 Tax=Pedobacter quisquiliarum TaxID=1834438 RepID=A0A916UKV9_9SPHI|nr:DUF6088 family protein [Pedobacter quisquiliarum]GGC75736.1 hypothetical protein GCM10011387_31890 [Pedobacter quisquiliarum]
MGKTHSEIENTLKRKKKGNLIFPTDFRGMGSEAAIKMALNRLNKENIIKRIAHGIYLIPKIDPLFGAISPSPEEVAEALAKKEKVNIKPTGAYALHKLGLTTQVPTKLVYLTDGSPREIKMGKTIIKFKATTSKKLAMAGPYSSLIIQALEELGTDNIDEQTESKIKALLRKESPALLLNDLKLAPAKINDYIIKLL